MPDFERLSHFRYQLRRFLRQSEEICCEHGLTSRQYQLLLHLRGCKGRSWATIGELTERLQAKHHGTVSLIDRCERAGWVKRHPGREDRRRMDVHLLAQGERLVDCIARQHQPELRHLQEEFSFPGWPDIPVSN